MNSIIFALEEADIWKLLVIKKRKEIDVNNFQNIAESAKCYR